MKKTVQIITVAFAISMLAVYVVYSQRQQNRTVAASSKSSILQENPGQFGGTNESSVTNITQRFTTIPIIPAPPVRDVVMPGSKSLNPVVQVRRDETIRSSAAPTNREWIPVSTSKFGQVFKLDSASKTQPIGGEVRLGYQLDVDRISPRAITSTTPVLTIGMATNPPVKKVSP